MAIVQVRQSSFAAGEVSPSLYGRTDFAKYDVAARKIRNWLVGPHGSLYNRPGTTLCAAAKNASDKIRLIPFAFSDGQTYVMEFGDHYVRFFQGGATVAAPTAATWLVGTTYQKYDAVTYSGVYYISRVSNNVGHTPAGVTNAYWYKITATGGVLELTSPYALADLPHLRFAQSGDVITFASANHPPYNLSRYPNSGWVFDRTPIGQASVKLTSSIISNCYWFPMTPFMDGYGGVLPQNLGQSAVPGWGAPLVPIDDYKLWGYAIAAVVDGVEYAPVYLNEFFMLPAATRSAYNTTTHPRGQAIQVYWENYTGIKVDQYRIYKGRRGRSGNYGLLAIVAADKIVFSGTTCYYVDDGSDTVDFTTPPLKGGAFPGSNVEANGGVIPMWTTGTLYNRFDWVQLNGHVYEAEITGKAYSSLGPSHTTGSWKDGTVANGPFVYGEEAITYGLNALTISNGNLYRAAAAGTINQLGGPSTGPYQTNLGIADGTVTWDYVDVGHPCVTWRYVGDVGKVYLDFPQVVTYVDQRLVFANSLQHPGHLWGSQVGNYQNFFDYHFPVIGADPYDFDLAYNTYEEVRGFIPAPKAFMALTSAVEWALTSGSNDAISATSINARPNSRRGCEWLDPFLIGNCGVFVQARLPRVRELLFDYYTQSYGGNDLSALATHLFDGYSFTDWAYVKVPIPTIWLVRSDGRLVSCTYIREQEMIAWHVHDTFDAVDAIENVCVISEADPNNPGAFTDMIYVVVRRNLVRYVERFAPRFLPRYASGSYDTVHGIFLDSAITYTGTNMVQFSGLSHLEGRSVMVLGDGNVYGPYTVSSGTIDITSANVDGVSFAIVGLQVNSDVEFLPPKVPGQDIKRSNVKLLPRISFELADSRGELWIGPTYTTMKPWRQRDVKDAYGFPQPFTGLEHARLSGVGYTHDVPLCIRQSDPLPVNLLAVEREIDVGGD